MWLLGGWQIVTKSGQNTLNVLLQILRDIDGVCESINNITSKTILTNIISTLSYRVAT